jgi:hypothetical protein
VGVELLVRFGVEVIRDNDLGNGVDSLGIVL